MDQAIVPGLFSKAQRDGVYGDERSGWSVGDLAVWD